MLESQNTLMSIAIDIGNSFSGYAFCSKSDYLRNSLNIPVSRWISRPTMYLKTVTCILFDPDQNFYAFGLEAEDRYGELALTNDHRNWYFFRGIKKEFYNFVIQVGYASLW